MGVVVGILIGTFYANHFSGNRLNIINTSGNKLNNLLHIIDDQYVDTVNVNDLVEKAMPQILSELDPHSVYITAREGEIANDDLRGSFSGIGIEFTIRQDTIRVQNVIGNGPAERAGVLAGDKIVEVDDSVFVGKKVTNEEAMHRLKGPKDTKVKLGIIRYGEKTIRHITVTRGEIPTKSVTASYMLDEESGYIKIRRSLPWPNWHRKASQTSSSTCVIIPEAILSLLCRLPMSSCPRDNSLSIRRDAVILGRTIGLMVAALTSTYHSLFLSTRSLLLHLRSLLAPFRITTVAPLLAVVLSARALCRSLWSSPITR